MYGKERHFFFFFFEIRKHKLMFCVLLRGGVVSALYRICSFDSLPWNAFTFLLFFTVSSLVSISLNFIPLLRVVFMARSFAGGSSMEKALNLRLFAKSRDHPQWRSGCVKSGQAEGTGFNSCWRPSFSLLPFFFFFVLSCLLICFAVFFCFVFKYILK